MYYDRRNKRLNKFEKAQRKAAEGPKPTTRSDSFRKRKRSLKFPPKRSIEDNQGLSVDCSDNPANSGDSPDEHEDGDFEGESSKMKKKPKREQRSPWTEEADR